MSFARYEQSDSVISSETVVRGLFSGDANTLTTFFTSSTFNEYYIDVYNVDPSNTSASIQFDVQYGHISGSGSFYINPNIPGNTPSRVVYGQYRNLVYGTENLNFNFSSSVDAVDIYVINVARARYKEALKPGSFNLTLASGSSSLQLTDDSLTTSLTRFVGQNIYYNIISGSNGTGDTTKNYGMMLPEIGVIILDPSQLTGSAGAIALPARVTSSVASNNHVKLVNAIKSGSNFQLQSSETVSSRFFFTRVKNSEFNYTTNPSIIDDSGNLLFSTLVNNPQTFATTVGMYNDNNELLAVAKLSRPLVKDFTKEYLLRIKLDY